jgi:uncharacterized protein YkwD
MFDIQNRIRTNPKSFIPDLVELLESFVDGTDNYIKDGIRWSTFEGTAAVAECIAYMQFATPVGALKWSDSLEEAAAFHAFNQGPTGKTGHDSVATSDNPAWSFSQRIQ